MVPEVDKLDTHQALDTQRNQLEAIRQEILSWSFMVPNEDRQGEAMALRQLANRSTQQARQWTGRMLKELGLRDYPYPNSSDSSTQVIDKSMVPVTTGLDLPADWTTVQKIKHVRAALSGINTGLEDILKQCIPGSFFNQCLFRVQEHSIQAAMWLGELLAEFVAVSQEQAARVDGEEFHILTEAPVALTEAGKAAVEADPILAAAMHPAPSEYEASGNDAAPTLSTTPDSPTENLGLGAESSPVVSSIDDANPESEVTATSALTPSLSAGSSPASEALAPAESASPHKKRKTSDQSVNK